jgi:hypothetical protein
MNRRNFTRGPQSPGGSEDTGIASGPALIAETHWEAKWLTADSAFDPAYERTNAALRRWVDGMEQALIANMSRRASPIRAVR